jgi:hypothetical protein
VTATVVRCGILINVLLLLVACNANQATTMGPLPTSASTVQPPPTPFTPLSGTTRYEFSASLSYPVHDYTAASTFTLYDNGTFLLHYGLGGSGGYVGAYRQEAERIHLQFDWPGWNAVGTLTGDSMKVRFNADMQLTDFENAVYRRVE